MRIEHDVTARPFREGDWEVKCFTCDFYDDDDGKGLQKNTALRVRRQHIEDNTAPPGMEPEMVPSWPWWTEGCDE